MKRCPTCQATFSDVTLHCPTDGAKLAAVSVTMGWDVPDVRDEVAPASAPTPAAAAAVAKPGSITAGWDVPDVPDDAVAAVASASTPVPAMPKERPQTPMKSSPLARKTLFGMGVVTELDATGEPAPDLAPAAAPALPEQERPTMAYPAAAPASAIYEAVTYEPGVDEPAPAQPAVDVHALAMAATETAIPREIAYAATAPSPAQAPVASRRESTVGEPPPSGNRTFLIVLIVMVLAAGGVAAALLLS